MRIFNIFFESFYYRFFYISKTSKKRKYTEIYKRFKIVSLLFLFEISEIFQIQYSKTYTDSDRYTYIVYFANNNFPKRIPAILYSYQYNSVKICQ